MVSKCYQSNHVPPIHITSISSSFDSPSDFDSSGTRQAALLHGRLNLSVEGAGDEVQEGTSHTASNEICIQEWATVVGGFMTIRLLRLGLCSTPEMSQQINVV